MKSKLLKHTNGILLWTLGLSMGLAVDEVTLPGAGSIKREGNKVSAEIMDCSVRASTTGPEFLVINPGVGMLSRNKEGTLVGCVEGLVMASLKRTESNVYIATSTKKAGWKGKQINSFEDMVKPTDGSVVVNMNTTRGKGEDIVHLEIARSAGTPGVFQNALTVLLSSDPDGLVSVFLVHDKGVALTVPKKLTPRDPIGKHYRYGYEK